MRRCEAEAACRRAGERARAGWPARISKQQGRQRFSRAMRSKQAVDDTQEESATEVRREWNDEVAAV